MLLGTKILLTSIVFIFVGAAIFSFGDTNEEDVPMIIGICILLASCVGIVVGILMNIWW